MQSRPFFRPPGTEDGLGGPAVGAASSVEIARALLGEESARRDNFDHDLLIIQALCLAQIGSLAVADQGFEQRLLRGAADVELHITAAGCAAFVVRRATPCRGARIGVRHQREGASRWRCRREAPAHDPLAFDNGELVAAKAARGRGVRCRAEAALEAVCRAPARVTVVTAGEEAAGDMDARVAPEFTVAFEQGAERDAFSVSEQPGRIMILVAVDGGDANRDIESAAMPPETAACWRRQANSGAKGAIPALGNLTRRAWLPDRYFIMLSLPAVGADNHDAAMGQRRANIKRM